MPKTPFKLTFSYTPKWKDNRKRPIEEQVSVLLKDFPERKRIEFREKIVADLPGVGIDPKAEAVATVEYQKKELAARETLVREYVVSISNLSIEVDGVDGAREIKTADDLIANCPELAAEIAERLFGGPGADELKN